MKFGMLFIGLGENHRSIDELAQTKKCFFGDTLRLFWDSQTLCVELSDLQRTGAMTTLPEALTGVSCRTYGQNLVGTAYATVA